MPNDEKMVIGMLRADTSATRRGMSRMTTMMTEMTDMSSSRRKFSTDSLTTLLWSVMVLMCTSPGRDCSKSSIILCTSLPIFTMSFPGRISMDRSTHLLPLLLMYLFSFGYSPSNPQSIGFSGILLAKRQNSFYCTYFLHNRNVADTKSPYPIKRLEVIRRFNQKDMAFNQSLS